MIYLYAAILTVANLAWLSTILFGLPGTWLMLLSALALDWLQPGPPLFGTSTLLACAALALAGEVAEFLLGAAGARKAGGSRRGAALAIVGGIAGAVLGTAIPIPVIGTLAGACLGAFAGSIAGDVAAGKTVDASMKAGRGAAVGRFWGTVAKMLVGATLLLTLAIAAIVQ